MEKQIRSLIANSTGEEIQRQESSFMMPWELEEDLMMVVFIELFPEIFECPRRRKSNRIFRHLSQYLKRRNPRQCRSHFQKKMTRHTIPSQYVKYYRDLVGNQRINEKLRQVQSDPPKIKQKKGYKSKESQPTIIKKETQEQVIEQKQQTTYIFPQDSINPLIFNPLGFQRYYYPFLYNFGLFNYSP